MHKTPIFFILAIVSVFLSNPALADDAVIYDSGKLSIGAWHVHLSKHTVQSDQPGMGYLDVVKNTPGSDIRAGFLILNHRLIPLTRFLTGPDATFNTKINLRQRNRLRVFLIGSPGASLTISVHGQAQNQPLPSVAFSAAPQTIAAGSASSLSWAAEHADSCTLTPGIGAVDTVGAMAVAPSTTTTYTITASGPGGTVSSTVTVTVSRPAPTFNLSASPLEIQRGQSATLTWASTNADACVITPDIGSVDTNGSVPVSPTETTTYTITASGTGAVATKSVTVVVIQPVPTVQISASPETIHPGDRATLTWDSTYADSCRIEPEVGVVDSSGSVSVTPMATTSYTITATGPGGTSTATVRITLAPHLGLQIISPVEGQTINRPDTMVHGTFTNSTGSETGIRVNGKLAATWNGHFVVNHVPLEEGANTITVTATDVNGDTQTATTSVTATLPGHHIEISPTLESCSSPLEASLHISGSFSIVDSSLTYAGSGPVEFLETGVDEYRVSLTDEGITYFTAEVIHEGVVYTDTIGMVVVNTAEIDALLQQKWADMKMQLSNRNVEGAVQYFAVSKKNLYYDIFSTLTDRLPQIAADMQDISIITIADKAAKYRIRRIEAHAAGSYPISYYIYFIKDENGIWMLYRL